MTYATTFSGIGGWELGLNACGWELKWQCEINPFCRAVLKERFGVPIYEDITRICDEAPPSVDALIGSPPCQPFSTSGEKIGVSDERHLYPAFIKLVGKIRPRYVLMEQVPNVLRICDGSAFGEYIGGLAGLRYDCIWYRIPACAIGANHQRDRLWIIAYSKSIGLQRVQLESGRNGSKEDSARKWSSGKSGFASLPRFDSCFQRNWQQEIQSALHRDDDGVSNWSHRVHALGNSVVPQIPFLIGQAINQIEAELTA